MICLCFLIRGYVCLHRHNHTCLVYIHEYLQTTLCLSKIHFPDFFTGSLDLLLLSEYQQILWIWNKGKNFPSLSNCHYYFLDSCCKSSCDSNCWWSFTYWCWWRYRIQHLAVDHSEAYRFKIRFTIYEGMWEINHIVFKILFCRYPQQFPSFLVWSLSFPLFSLTFQFTK